MHSAGFLLPHPSRLIEHVYAEHIRICSGSVFIVCLVNKTSTWQFSRPQVKLISATVPSNVEVYASIAHECENRLADPTIAELAYDACCIL